MLSPTFSLVSKCPVMILLYAEKPKSSLFPMKREGMQSLHKEVEGKMKKDRLPGEWCSFCQSPYSQKLI